MDRSECEKDFSIHLLKKCGFFSRRQFPPPFMNWQPLNKWESWLGYKTPLLLSIHSILKLYRFFICLVKWYSVKYVSTFNVEAILCNPKYSTWKDTIMKKWMASSSTINHLSWIQSSSNLLSNDLLDKS